MYGTDLRFYPRHRGGGRSKAGAARREETLGDTRGIATVHTPHTECTEMACNATSTVCRGAACANERSELNTDLEKFSFVSH